MKFGMAVMTIGCMTLSACASVGGGGIPRGAVQQVDYSNAAAPRHSYAPYETPSHLHTLPLSDDVTEVYIGGDLEPRETLRHIATTGNGISYFMGRVEGWGRGGATQELSARPRDPGWSRSRRLGWG